VPEITPAIAAPVPNAPAPVAGVAPATPAATDAASASDFMGQLTAALKGLKGIAAAVKGLPVAPATATDNTGVGPVAPAAYDSTQNPGATPKTPSDDVTELLATLGLVLVPTPQTAPLATDTPIATDAKAASTPVAAALAQVQAANQQAAQAQPAPSDPAQSAMASVPQAVQPHFAQHLAAPTAAPDPAPATTADAQPASTDAQPVPQQPSTPQPTAPAPTGPVLQPQLNSVGSDGAFQQGPQDGDGRHHDAQKSAPIEAGAAERTQPLPEHVYAEVVNNATATTANAAPANAQSADVASQIAQQVDLYRLPGNKGVRIQLHPEDLGGVQVTVRYAAGGNLELHINVEHAATGNLVQAGLSQLRDALATQGFHPDRMVMSITAPSSSSGMDFNSNSGNGSYRAGAEMSMFTQDQSGQNRPSDEDQRGPRGWRTSTGDTGPAPDDSRAATPAVALPSRIDYRV
jgi:flagellar hook-length control protein FliK